MTPEDIATIRNLRGFNVPWPRVAKTVGCSVASAREAIGLPAKYEQRERQPLPWNTTEHRNLFTDTEGAE